MVYPWFEKGGTVQYCAQGRVLLGGGGNEGVALRSSPPALVPPSPQNSHTNY